jgi:hypothetical protein
MFVNVLVAAASATTTFVVSRRNRATTSKSDEENASSSSKKVTYALFDDFQIMNSRRRVAFYKHAGEQQRDHRFPAVSGARREDAVETFTAAAEMLLSNVSSRFFRQIHVR